MGTRMGDSIRVVGESGGTTAGGGNKRHSTRASGGLRAEIAVPHGGHRDPDAVNLGSRRLLRRLGKAAWWRARYSVPQDA